MTAAAIAAAAIAAAVAAAACAHIRADAFRAWRSRARVPHV